MTGDLVVVIDYSGDGTKVYGVVAAREGDLSRLSKYSSSFPHFADLGRLEKLKLVKRFETRLERVRGLLHLLYTTTDPRLALEALRRLLAGGACR